MIFRSRYVQHLETEVQRLRAELATAHTDHAIMVQSYKREYEKLVDRLCAKQGVPESPKEVRAWVKEQIESSDLFQEEEMDPREDNREPVDTLAG